MQSIRRSTPNADRMVESASVYVSEIWIYPVKSLGGFRVKNAQVMEAGFEFDRRWMMVDENGKFLTQREIPSMSLLRADVLPDGLLISKIDGSDRIVVPDSEICWDQTSVKVWDDAVMAHKYSRWVNNWLSDKLARHVSLVQLPSLSGRPFMKEGRPSGTLSFADDFPYHMISQSSLDDLNARLDDPIAVKRFRPNLIIVGSVPYDDDHWAQMHIGEATFDLPSRCERCIMVNVNKGKIVKQPLKALAGYRRDGRFIYFGQNMVATKFGTISEGDPVRISYR